MDRWQWNIETNSQHTVTFEINAWIASKRLCVDGKQVFKRSVGLVSLGRFPVPLEPGYYGEVVLATDRSKFPFQLKCDFLLNGQVVAKEKEDRDPSYSNVTQRVLIAGAMGGAVPTLGLVGAIPFIVGVL